jgi:outer membrane immunogenic protein
MRFALASGLLLAVLVTGAPAAAADMPVKAPPAPAPVSVPTWTGTYIGINGGFGWATTNHTDVFGVTTGSFNQSGGMAGVTYGGNWQSGPYVLGFEGDFDWADIKGTLTTAGPPLGLCSINGGTTCFTKIKEFSTERMRAGYDFNGWLLFGTGGVAFARVNAGQNPCGPVPVGVGIGGGNSCNEEWRTGWVAGVGVEKMFLPHWSAKIEYLHFDLGNAIQYMPTAVAGGSSVHVLERGDIVRVGINYQFDFLSLLNLH